MTQQEPGSDRRVDWPQSRLKKRSRDPRQITSIPVQWGPNLCAPVLMGSKQQGSWQERKYLDAASGLAEAVPSHHPPLPR
jgi:hypothetical protein